jgi:hypothetical protein
MVGRRNNLGKRAVEAIQSLKLTLNSYKTTVSELEERLNRGLSGDDGDADVVDIVAELNEARKMTATLEANIRRKRQALGVDGRLSLEKLSESKFLQLRMTACALKLRIRERLRQRKFELELLERAYRHHTNGKWLFFFDFFFVLTSKQNANFRVTQRAR